jgi:hypothetical protein
VHPEKRSVVIKIKVAKMACFIFSPLVKEQTLIYAFANINKMSRLFFDVFVGMLAEGIVWWRLFFGFVAYVVDALGFADFFFVSSFAAFKAVCWDMKRFENSDESDYACVPNAQSDRS